MTEGERTVLTHQVGDLLSDVQQFCNRCLYHLDRNSAFIAYASLEAARDKLGLAMHRVSQLRDTSMSPMREDSIESANASASHKAAPLGRTSKRSCAAKESEDGQ